MKLTNAIRDAILENAMLASEIPGRRKNTAHELKEFALVAYEYAVKPPKELLDMWSSSEGRTKFGPWLNTMGGITLEREGVFDSYNFANRPSDDHYAQFLPSYVSMDDPKLCKAQRPIVQIKGTPLEPRAQALSKYHQDTNKKEKELRGTLRGVLNAANTKAQLLKIWPEAEKFLPAEAKVEPQRALVDVKSILELNKALGISK